MQYKKELFEVLGRIANAISYTLGKHCEIAIHDMEDPNRSLVHLAGNVTGRSTGAPITNFGLKLIALKEKSEDVYGYQTRFNGKTIISSTVCIKDQAGKPVGFFCINYDISKLSDVQNTMLEYGLQHIDMYDSSNETFSDHSGKTIDYILNDIVAEMKKEPALMSMKDRISFIRNLNVR